MPPKSPDPAPPLPSRPAAAGRSMGQAAYEQLHEAIETGQIKPGDRVSVNALAETLQMSRTPVREAIAWLETDGLIVHEPYLGRVVASLDRQMITELYAIRLVLETTAAGLAAQNASEAEVAVLQDMLAMEQQVLADPIRRERHNRRFHEAIYRSAHNRYLLTSLKALQSPMVLLGPATASDPGRLESAYAEHIDLVDSIARHDVDGARAAITRHLAGGQRSRLRYMMQREQG
ncbi:MAG: GntR family transcriptional regulator [Rubrivivax sp.]|nr:GntR family transcriptional regulator [Rubrivivax sp.]